MGDGEESERLVRIDHAPARGPLVVKLPAPREKLSTLGKTVGAAEHDDDQVSRDRSRVAAVRLNFRFAMRGENQAIAGARGLTRLDAIDAVRSEKLIGIAQLISLLLSAAAERNLSLLLRNIKTERCLVHRVAREARQV
jgi:hypothetical protein